MSERLFDVRYFFRGTRFFAMGGRDSVGRVFYRDTAKLFHVSNPAGFW